jgi:hypothetical protein
MTLRHCQCDRRDCPECGPLVLLAEQIRLEFEQTRAEARVPTPELMWWRAQMRAHEEAARKAARPILFSQAVALAALIGLFVALAGRVTAPMLALADVSRSTGFPFVGLVIAAASCLLVAPIALYFALARD